ncbi:phosphatidylserine decarboxylase-domain-containing protein [Phlebopus sp. FC_14]|nr:phosphatidylserine decarboxylase-domain-containing protein [Phlebopus sp. FC_14]
MFLHESSLTKPIEKIHHLSLSSTKDDIAHGLVQAVGHTKSNGDAATGIYGPAHSSLPWLHKLVPELQTLANKYHIGNFVVIRDTNERFFESMPIYARLGMHLLFYGKQQVKLLEGSKHVEDLLREQSTRQGKIYDSHESIKNIPSFIKTYNIQLDELLEPDIHKYNTFNEFFYRKLKDGVRPVQNAEDPNAFCSAADCRLVVYQTVDLAEKFWIKGDEFSIPALLDLDPIDPLCQTFSGGSLAIFRLAPADYHRFHSPVDATVLGKPRDVPGQYYTVNPQAVNEPKLDVLSKNKRSVMLLEHTVSKKPIAFIAVGALLVGSIVWTPADDAVVKRGDELGYFAYGGSTIVAVFPPGVIKFDEDLVRNSIGADGKGSVETLVKVGYSLGRMPAA